MKVKSLCKRYTTVVARISFQTTAGAIIELSECMLVSRKDCQIHWSSQWPKLRASDKLFVVFHMLFTIISSIVRAKVFQAMRQWHSSKWPWCEYCIPFKGQFIWNGVGPDRWAGPHNRGLLPRSAQAWYLYFHLSRWYTYLCWYEKLPSQLKLRPN